MRVSDLKATITIPFVFDKPDENGNVYTREAVEKAVGDLVGTPLTYTNKCLTEIGKIVSEPMVEWDYDNKVCNVTIDVIIYSGGSNEEIILSEDESKIIGMDIISVGF